MRRRQFLAGVSSYVVASRSSLAQQPAAMPVVGFLRSAAAATSEDLTTAFRDGLKEQGFVEGQNVTTEYRYAENRIELLPALAADLLARRPAAIVGDNLSAIALKAATGSVPIVFATGGDPVAQGLVASLNRPGGNLTGVAFFSTGIGSKRLELLHHLAPGATTIGVLVNANSPSTRAERSDVQAAAAAIGQQLVMLDVDSESAIENAFASISRRGVSALLVGAGTFTSSWRERIVALAARYRLPASYPFREYAAAGGLMSYGASVTEAYRQVGNYAGRILKGERPADLPVMRSTKFEFVLNLKTAKALGLEIPPTLLALADEVIE